MLTHFRQFFPHSEMALSPSSFLSTQFLQPSINHGNPNSSSSLSFCKNSFSAIFLCVSILLVRVSAWFGALGLRDASYFSLIWHLFNSVVMLYNFCLFSTFLEFIVRKTWWVLAILWKSVWDICCLSSSGGLLMEIWIEGYYSPFLFGSYLFLREGSKARRNKVSGFPLLGSWVSNFISGTRQRDNHS